MGKTLAMEPVAERLGLTQAGAREFILDHVTRLSVENFSETLTRKHPPADVYGIEARSAGWYVKIALDSESLVVISFHPPKEPLRTPAGTVKR